ncbi:EF-hand calcium-binding domain-containing protein 3 [Rhea pennata]|uniref:EF-hand calcium-binding domain-containing protein 3 n=1 Tax=Rhea pennata TaxID=8795 RepID=UPI002E26B718
MQEVLQHVTVNADGKVNLSEFMYRVKTAQSTAQGAEKAAHAPGHVPKASLLNSLPMNMVPKSLPGKTTRERSHIAQKRIKCKAAKNLTKKQLEAFSDAFNFFPKDPDGNINLRSLQKTAKELGISLTRQEANDELLYADADRDGKVNFSDFLTIVTDNKRFMQAIVPQKNYTGNFDSVNASGILLFEVLSKLVELAALPQRTLLEIVRYYRQKFVNCTGQKAWKDSDSLMYCRKNHRKIRKDQAYVSSFVNAARLSFMNDKDLAAYVESLKACVPLSDSPYAQVPIFPLIPKQEAVVAGRPKKDLQKLERQRRNEPIASFENHFFHKRNWVQEVAALKLPAHFKKQRISPRVNSEVLNKPCHLRANKLDKIQADMDRATQLYRQSLALHERARLLKLWRRIRGGQIGLETGSERFHHIFSVYSWSWNVRQELVTPDDLRKVDNELYRRSRGSSARASRAAARRKGPAVRRGQ